MDISASRLDQFIPAETAAGTVWIEEWVVPDLVWTLCRRAKLFVQSRIRTTIAWLSARSIGIVRTSLSRLGPRQKHVIISSIMESHRLLREAETEFLLRRVMNICHFGYPCCEICDGKITARGCFPNRVRRFFPSITFHHYPTFKFALILLFSEGQAGEFWVLPK
jgi:hypothetical protein